VAKGRLAEDAEVPADSATEDRQQGEWYARAWLQWHGRLEHPAGEAGPGPCKGEGSRRALGLQKAAAAKGQTNILKFFGKAPPAAARRADHYYACFYRVHS
jgi:hypothetical protein